MKWRIKRKKIKKHHICDMWLKCQNDWHQVLKNIESKYDLETDINSYYKTDYDICVIGCEMLRYDWIQYLKEGEKIGFGFRIMNKYANEKIF